MGVHERFEEIGEMYTNLNEGQALKITYGFGNFEPDEKIIYPGDYISLEINRYDNRAEIHFWCEGEAAYQSYFKVYMDAIRNIEVIHLDDETKELKFAKFRQKMCDLLWECNCDHIGLSDETNAKNIFDNAHYICNKLLEDYEISDKK